MRVTLVRQGRTFRYQLHPESDDPAEGRRKFEDCPTPFRLVRRGYRVVVPSSFRWIHPDTHALAIWHAIGPVVGSRLDLPFETSPDLAQWLIKNRGPRLARVGERQRPRRRPRAPAPALLFSGGMDSMAASLLLPAQTHHLFLDRIPHPSPAQDGLVDLKRQRAACTAVRAAGRPVHRTADDHEYLFEPYPMWHSDMAPLSALYLADSLGLGTLDTGNVLDCMYFGGYHPGQREHWRMKPLEQPADSGRGIGLETANSIGGLSEVATTAIVARSRHRGKSFSCYYPADGAFCLRCDKCFKKMILRHVADDEEVPESLFEHFLGMPHLAAIFTRPFFDWHHVWFYLFQRMRCRHWFAVELKKQAEKGPDLSVLEKWYPNAANAMAGAYADVVRENIGRWVATMSPSETRAFEQLDVPPLHAPALTERRPRPAAGIAAPGSGPPRETTALFKLLSSKLTTRPPLRWGPYTLEDISLRARDPSVWLRLKADGDEIFMRLFRITQPEDKYLVRAGCLGFAFDPHPPAQAAVRQAVRGVVSALADAQRELGRPRIKRHETL